MIDIYNIYYQENSFEILNNANENTLRNHVKS